MVTQITQDPELVRDVAGRLIRAFDALQGAVPVALSGGDQSSSSAGLRDKVDAATKIHAHNRMVLLAEILKLSRELRKAAGSLEGLEEQYRGDLYRVESGIQAELVSYFHAAPGGTVGAAPGGTVGAPPMCTAPLETPPGGVAPVGAAQFVPPSGGSALGGAPVAGQGGGSW